LERAHFAVARRILDQVTPRFADASLCLVGRRAGQRSASLLSSENYVHLVPFVEDEHTVF
jgi:hypothetical protein